MHLRNKLNFWYAHYHEDMNTSGLSHKVNMKPMES